MADYWTDAPRPRFRPWWELGQAPEQQAEYPPIGLEAFRPEAPQPIGFNVQAPQRDAAEEFAQSWLPLPSDESDAPSMPGVRLDVPPAWLSNQGTGWTPDVSEGGRVAPWLYRQDEVIPGQADTPATEASASSSATPFDRVRIRNPWLVDAQAGALARQTAAAVAAAGSALAGSGKAIADGFNAGMETLGSYATDMAALFNPLHAPSFWGNPADRGAKTTDLGNNYRLVERADGTTSITESDGGFLGTGLGESVVTLPVEARATRRSDGTREYVIDWEGLQRRIGYDKTLEAMQKLPAGMGGPQKEPGDPPPPDDKPSLPLSPDYFTRRLLRRFPDLIQRDTDHWATEDFEPNDAEREHEQSCEEIQKRRGEEPPNGTYSGPNALDTPFGPVPPELGSPAAQERPENRSHDSGIRGETEMATRLYNLGRGYLIPYYGNPPGVNGPDGIAVGDKSRSIMLLESKYSTNPRPVGGPAVIMSPQSSNLVDQRMRQAVDQERIPRDIAEEALRKFHSGNYSGCLGGTGNAHNGYAIHYRDGNAVSVKRIR